MEEKISKIASNFNSNLNLLRDFVNSLDPVLKKRALGVDKKTVELVAYVMHELIKKKISEKDELEKFELGKDESKENMDDIKKYVKENHIELNLEKENSISIKCSNKETLTNMQNLFDTLDDVSTKTDILYKSSLMSLVVYFESMFAELFKYIFNKNPECVIEKKSLTFSEIKKLGSIENAINYIIEKEVESRMYKGFDDWCKYLNMNIKLSMKYLNNSKDEVTEIIARRNLFVHNQGKVNSIYLSKVSSIYSKGLKKDTELGVNKTYINKAINSIEKLGNLILIDLMKKYHEDYWKYAFDLGYEFLINEKWKTSLEINNLIKDDKKASSKDKLMAKMNYWQAFKWSGNFDKVKKEVDLFDYSAYSDDIQLGILALKDDFDNFFKLLPQVYPSQISCKELEEWPIFREVRKDERLNEFLNNDNKKEVS